MAAILSLSGSPSPASRTGRLLDVVSGRLTAQGHEVTRLDVRRLPGDVLTGADPGRPELLAVAELVTAADGVVVGTPVYKAAYSGLLKCLFDLLPQYALAEKTVLPLATGGSPAHVLAVDYALRPVLTAMGATHVLPGWFVLDRHILPRPDDGGTDLDPSVPPLLDPLVDRFSAALSRSATVPAVSR
jgi:FMN reductase